MVSIALIFGLVMMSSMCVICSENYVKLKEVVKTLNDIHHFGTIAVFICEELRLDFDDMFQLLSSDKEYPVKPKLLITRNFSRSIKMEKVISGSLFTLVLADNHKSYILELASKILRGMRQNPVIFFFRRKRSHLKDILNTFCEWTYKTQFINSLVMFEHSAEKYGCELFPNPQMIDQTLLPAASWLSNSVRNGALDFKGKTFRFPIADDKPRAFSAPFIGMANRTKGYGVCYQVFKNFIKQNNGKIDPYPLYGPDDEYKSINEVVEMIEDKALISSPSCFSEIDPEKFSSSYPIKTVDWCFMVPVVGKIPSYEYINIPFHLETKLALGAAIILSGVVFWLLGGLENLSLGLLNGLCGYLALGFCTNLDKHHILTSRSFQIFIRLAGFIFSIFYNSLLSSFLATTLYGKQIETLADLDQSGLQVMIRINDSMSLEKYGIPTFFKKHFLIKRRNIVSDHRDNLDASYAYMVSSDRWLFLNGQQAKMRLNRLRYSKICYAKLFLAFLLWYDNMFTEPLNHFIINSLSSGLINFWTNKAYRDYEKYIEKNVSLTESDATPMDLVFATPMDLTYFTYAWWCLFIGLLVSFVVFIMEGVCFNIKHWL